MTENKTTPINHVSQNVWLSCSNLSKGYFQNLAFLFFSSNIWLGCAIAIALTLKPFMLLSSISAYFISLLMARFLKVVPSLKNLFRNETALNHTGFYAYNSLLVALLVASEFQMTWLAYLYMTLLVIGTYVLSLALSQACWNLFRLPLLNLSFALMALVMNLASQSYSNLMVAESYAYDVLNFDNLAAILHGYFQSLGTLIFLPYDFIGVLLCVALFLSSRIYAFLSLLGYGTGIIILFLLKGSWVQAIGNPYHFNFILIAWALGGYFIIPSRFSFVVATIGVAVAVPILDAMSGFWVTYGLPVFTIPFIAATFVALYVIQNLRHPLITKIFLKSPEQNLNHHITVNARFPQDKAMVSLPFSGSWNVYQGCFGNWTHVGPWAYALDFTIQNDGKGYLNDGKVLADYPCFGKPVLSPVTGVVYSAYDELPDNAIGTVDKENNWGNYILIWVESGRYFVELSHLQHKSLKIKIGDVVVAGQILAKCGNSGYSPEPHIHMQIQALAALGSPTLDFRIIQCQVDENFHFHYEANDLKQGSVLANLSPSKKQEGSWQFILDEVQEFEILKNNIFWKKFSMVVGLSAYGEYFLTEKYDSDFNVKENSRLYFSKSKGVLSFYKYEGASNNVLAQLFMAMPRLPLSEEACQWEEPIDLLLSRKWIMKFYGLQSLGLFLPTYWMTGLIRSLVPKMVFAKAWYQKVRSENVVKGNIQAKGFGWNGRAQTKVSWLRNEGVVSLSFITSSETYSWKRIFNEKGEQNV